MEQVARRVYPSLRQVSHDLNNAGVVELVDTMDSKSIERKLVPDLTTGWLIGSVGSIKL